MQEMDPKYFECMCFDASHTLRLTGNKEDVWVEYHLHTCAGFFKRIWLALKYVFGCRQFEGHFDCTIFYKRDIPRLIDILQETVIVPEEYEILTKKEIKELERYMASRRTKGD
ncbi:hypothetical protein N8Z24_00545 [bacterium]|nr:hypothetical protein [bacterium]